MISINKDKLNCPTCGSSTRRAIAIDGGHSRFWMKCVRCETYIDTYIPMPHQKLMHNDPARYILVAGGYGSGKTEFDNKDVQKHIFLTPVGQTLLGAPTYPQLISTLKKDFESDFPMGLVRRVYVKDMKVVMLNGHEVLYRSFDDPDKFRSLNLSRFVILEGSGARFSTFTQLRSRLRNIAATIPERDRDGNLVFQTDEETGRQVMKLLADWRKGTVESNPDPGWIKVEALETSGTVYFHGVDPELYRYHDINPSMSTHIVPTSANFMLPPDFEKEQSVGKPVWWIKRYFKGSFTYAEGMIYPRTMERVIKPFAIPKHWKRLIAMDYGISDNTHFVFGAIDPDQRRCYIYKELVMNRSNVKEISAKYIQELQDIPFGGMLRTPVMDQRSMSQPEKIDVTRTLGDLFADEGVLFDPAQMNLDARILQTASLMDLGQLWFFDTCPILIGELVGYIFVPKDLDKPGKDTDKPVDKRNHGVNALEFLCMELPRNLESYDFTMYNRAGKPVTGFVHTPRKTLVVPMGLDPFKDRIQPSHGLFPSEREDELIDDFYNSYSDNLYDPVGGGVDFDSEADGDTD